MLSPDIIAAKLRRIASKIDASKNPSTSLVQQDLRNLTTSITRDSRLERIAAEIYHIAQDDTIDAGPWESDEGVEVERRMKDARKEDDEHRLAPFLKRVKEEIDNFLVELKRDPNTPKAKKPEDHDVVTKTKENESVSG